MDTQTEQLIKLAMDYVSLNGGAVIVNDILIRLPRESSRIEISTEWK